MKTIIFAALKGGTGKTTLAWNVALEAAQEGTVYLIDQDPQKSLTKIVSECSSLPSTIKMLENVGSVSDMVRRLRRNGAEKDFVIVDTPGSFVNVIEDAIEVSDCIVLPLQPSPLDYAAQQDILPKINRFKKQKVSLFVLNKADNRSVLAREIFLLLRNKGKNRPIQINQRVAYAKSCIGDTVSAGKLDLKAEIELRSLWKAVKGVLTK